VSRQRMAKLCPLTLAQLLTPALGRSAGGGGNGLLPDCFCLEMALLGKALLMAGGRSVLISIPANHGDGILRPYRTIPLRSAACLVPSVLRHFVTSLPSVLFLALAGKVSCSVCPEGNTVSAMV